MIRGNLRLDAEFVKRLVDQYKWDHAATAQASGTPNKSRHLQHASTHIRQILEVSFWASLTPEEGKYNSFTIAYLDCDPKAFGKHQEPFLLHKPLPFDAGTLAKLAPALPDSKVIGIWPRGVSNSSTNTGELFIWGFAPRLIGYSLSVNVVQPGQILISLREDCKAFLTGLNSRFIDESKLFKRSELFGNVIAPVSGANGVLIRAHRASDFQRVVSSMRAHGHGGTLLVLPSNESSLKKSLRIKFTGTYDRIKDDLDERDRYLRSFNGTMFGPGSISERVERSLDAIGRFTAVDGATVITYDMLVLGFGATITPKGKKYPQRVLVSEPFEGSAPTECEASKLGAHRHQSAAQFVFDQRNALAIVASQDGRLSLFAWDPNKNLVNVTVNAELLLL
jgi:hypothetical protein